MFNRPFLGCCNQLPPAPATCQHVANTVNTCNVQEHPHIVNFHTHHQNSLIKKHVTIPQYTFSEGAQVFDEFAQGPMGVPFAQPFEQAFPMMPNQMMQAPFEQPLPQQFGQAPFGQSFPMMPNQIMQGPSGHHHGYHHGCGHHAHQTHGFECLCKKQQSQR